MTKTYTAWAINANGDKDTYTGLTKSRAVWRYRWFERMAGRVGYRSFGWRLDA